MNNLKEANIRKAIWHIRRHLNELLNSQDEKYRKLEMFHIKSSIECLERIMNNKKPIHLWIRKKCFKSEIMLYSILRSSYQIENLSPLLSNGNI